MRKVNRRQFLGRSTRVTGALSIIPFLGCQSNSTKEDSATAKQTNIRNPLSILEREKVSITDIKVTPLSYLPPNDEILWGVGKYVVWKTDAALVEIFTDQGLVGFAEGSPYSNPGEIKKYTDTHITPVLKGKNPFDIDYLGAGGPWQDYLARAAWAGVENACWDIIGKIKNQPVYKLLATDCEPEQQMPIYASGGVSHKWYEDGATQLIEEALRYKSMGFTALKFRNGTDWDYSKMTLKKYIPVLRRLRQAVGPDFKLMIEKHNWSFEEITEQLCPVLEDLKFYWYEEPMNQWEEGSIERHLKIKEAMPSVMVSGGERFTNRFQLQRWIAEGAYDIIQSDCNFTGISENWHISRMAHLYGRLQCPHNWHGGLTTISNIHFVASCPNGHMCELNQTYNPLKEDIFKEPLVAENGMMSLPDKPGFGVELIDDIEKKFPWVPGSYLKPNPKMSG
ncbi:MAG: mandelate racemase/muconate lactonizing enzyme family protein [Saprospiraceae bacterium]|nr:mandelate racemase/muconate lactonizing enzyme family protein [Saprospiraceae bacterium]